MKKLFLTTVLCLAGAAMVSAQSLGEMFGNDQRGGITFGVRVGMNISNISGEEGPDRDDKLDLDSRIGFQAGAIVDLPITNGFYIQPGLFITTRGAKKKTTDRDEDYTYKRTDKYNPIYLQIPVLASFRTDISQSVKVQVNVGPYFSLGLGGKHKWESQESGESTRKKDIPFFGKSTDKESHFGAKRFDLGLSFGAGVTIREHYYVGIQYDLGLMNMAIHDKEYGWGDKAKFHNGNFAIQLGYNF